MQKTFHIYTILLIFETNTQYIHKDYFKGVIDMNKKLGLLFTILGIAVIAFAAVNLFGNKDKDGITIISGDAETVVAWDEIALEDFSGELVNGKGEVTASDYEGIELVELLAANGIKFDDNSEIVVTAEDNYSATLTGAEVLTGQRVYVALSANGEMVEGLEGGQGAQLIVFGDPNSKRAVRCMKTIEIK